MASPTVRVALSAARVIEADNLPISPQACQHLVVAALVGNGATSFEHMNDTGLPIVADETQAGHIRSTLPIWHRQLRDDVVFDRAGKALARAFMRLDQPQPTGIELDFLKLRVTDIVTKQIREQGLCVYTQKLLFSPKFVEIGMDVLGEMKLPELPPVAASAAIATGHVPPLPSRNLKEHLQFLNSEQILGASWPRGSFAEWIAKAAPVVVEFPAPNLGVGRQCRTDRFTTGYRTSADLGMGFFLATTYDQVGDRLQVVTPMLFHRAAPDGSLQPWRAEFLNKQFSQHITSHDENSRLQKAMLDIGGQSARLKVCPSCSEIYSNDRADLRLSCSCARTSYQWR